MFSGYNQMNSLFNLMPAHLDRVNVDQSVAIFRDLLWCHARKHGVPITKVHISSRVTVSDGGVDAKIDDDMQSAEKRHVAYLEKLEMLKKKFDYEISNDKKETNLLYKGFKFNGKLPVAMGGCTLFKLNESTEPIALILNVIPQVKETYVFCMTEADNHTLFQQIINTSFDTPIQVLKFIEFFMMHGTDNWFYTPSEWDYIPDWKKENMEQIGIPKFGYTFKELSYNIIDLDRISK
jgi:hypothetical protein